MSVTSILRYIFYPNPGQSSYTTTSMMLLLALCAALVVTSIALRFWRKNLENPVTRKLSRSWASAALWFGIVGAVLVVSRVEGIQFLAMRFLWLVWGLAFLAYVFIQYRLFTKKHYEILPRVKVEDARDRYIPGKGMKNR